jgi:hypothetical protein
MLSDLNLIRVTPTRNPIRAFRQPGILAAALQQNRVHSYSLLARFW